MTTRKPKKSRKTVEQPRILVCGGRNFDDRALLTNTLHDICDERGWNHEPEPATGNYLPNVRIIAGGASGADQLATDWAVVNWTGLSEYPADWQKHGKAAGPIRNQQMLDEGKPDLVVAFPGGKGTADMVRRARKANIEVIEVK